MAGEPTSDWADGGRLITGEAVVLEVRPTGWALRAGGTIIDVVLSLIVFAIIMLAVSAVGGALQVESVVYTIAAIVSLVFSLVIVPASVETITHGKSLGRLAVGARIVRSDGGASGLRQALIRALVGVLELYLTFGGLAAIVGLLTPRTQRLGDLMAGTYSQYERADGTPPPAFSAPIPLQAWARTADVARLPEALARRVRQFLGQAQGLDPARRAYVARELANDVAPYVSPLPAIDPELFLAGVIAVRREREDAALRLEARRLGQVEGALSGLPHAFPTRD